VTEGLATDGPRRIVDHRALDDRHRLLTLAADDALAGFRPGQFAMLSCGDGLLLRRPFSLQRSALCDGVRVVELLYRVVGRGTAALASLTPGTVVTALGPLGRPFDPPPAGARPVLLGGGVGIPPMVALAEALLATDGEPPLVIGGVSGVRDLACLEGLRQLPLPIAVATLDGGEGTRGTVLDALDGAGTDLRDACLQLYACGPIPMLAAVAARAREIGAGCQVSVEALMGCGYGACVGCAVPRSGEARSRGAMRWALACKDGPVFDARQLDLDGMEEPGG
jgi:dihydroorotate dehydrogenase electron transfer subunit